MSWLNEELPTDWPSKTSNNHDDSSVEFSTSQSADSVMVDPTVAINSGPSSTAPQWKQAIQPPKAKESSHRLTRLFVSPVVTPDADNMNSTKPGDRNQPPLTTNSQNDTTSSVSSSLDKDEEDEPNAPISRRLKVFGRPDTYTNERLGNLLSSMGGANTHTTTSLDHSPHFNVTEDKMTMDMSANDTDGDVADNLQNEGRKVLQGLAPFRPNLSAVPESSLDKLEQQLTSQGTTPQLESDRSGLGNSRPIETTSSSIANSNDTSNTLDSLPAGYSNWDTTGVYQDQRHRSNDYPNSHITPHSSVRQPRPFTEAYKHPLHKHSSRTLIGSGRSGKGNIGNEVRQQSYLDPEAEISALGIRDVSSGIRDSPVNDNEQDYPRAVDLSANNSIQHISNENITSSSEQPTSTDLNSFQENPQHHIYTERAQHPRIRSQHAFDITPDRIARKYLSFNSHERTHSHTKNSTASKSHRSERETPHNVECSIAAKDVSFSGVYEQLAQLIRERGNVNIASSMDSLDSLDLSNCNLETIAGLDRFVPELTTLFLHDNSIRSLQGLPFNLVHLDLSSNRLSNINTFPVSFVSTLILTNNELQSLEPLANLRALSSLDLSGNKLTSLRGIEKLTALRTLNLRDNMLKSLDINLGLLVELDAANNEISAVNIQAPNLESLDLEGNNVVAFNQPMPNLRELNIRYNNATVDFSGWQSLETLLFDGNRAVINFQSVSEILVTFSWEQRRKPFKQRNAYQQNVPAHLLTSTRDLKLSGRELGWPLQTVRTTIFSAQHLDLSLNGIRELPSNFADTFPFLRSLNLSFNKLDSRCISILTQCSKLERLSLFGNRLDISGEKLARMIPSLRMLDLRAQHRSTGIIEYEEYPTTVYSIISEASESGTIVNTSCPELQWLDGKWTNRAANIKPTTRPGFPSALYPESWNPPLPTESLRAGANVTVDGESTLDTLTAWDIMEAMYVHHYLRTANLLTEPLRA